MPQTMVTVYHCETGKPELKHSVDAEEAVKLGDYTYMPPEGEEASPEDMAAARAKAQGLPTVHPELLSPAERQARRDEANALERVKQMTGTLQAGTPVIVVPEKEALPTGMQDRRRGEHAAVRPSMPDPGKK